MAALAKNLYDVWHSYSACGRLDNELFKKHSGALKCHSHDVDSNDVDSDDVDRSERSMNSAKVFTPSLLGVLLIIVQLVLLL